jgi:hypothetical protein
MTFTRPANAVAYEEDTTRAAGLLSRAGYLALRGPTGVPPLATFTPPPFWQLQHRWTPTVLLHARVTPSGRKRLVVIGIENQGGQEFPTGKLTDRIIRISGSGNVPATLSPASEVQGAARNQLCLYLKSQDVIRLFWGQVDPDHADHFTIGYLLNDQPGTIDGWLKDDGQVDLRVRDGPATKIASKLPY